MYASFTANARKVLLIANRAADGDHIGTAHLLLGLLDDTPTVAARALGELNVDLDALRIEVEALSKSGRDPEAVPVRLKQSIEEALALKDTMNDYRVDCEHLLLGLLREGDGLAAQLLNKHGVTFERTMAAVVKLRDPGH
jgi:ATP-dependent Clp protease ATP-binding subunit ClpC